MGIHRLVMHISSIEEGKHIACTCNDGIIVKVGWHTPSQSYQVTCVCGATILVTPTGSYIGRK